MSYGDERSEARRLRSILEEGDRMTSALGSMPRQRDILVWEMVKAGWNEAHAEAQLDRVVAEAATPTVEPDRSDLDVVAITHSSNEDEDAVEQSGPPNWDALAKAQRVANDQTPTASWPNTDWLEAFAAEYARLVPQPARPADTALREAVIAAMDDYGYPPTEEAWEVITALAEQATSSEQDR